MPFETEDKNPSLGDPSTLTTTPLNQKQMQGAQKATVNRTQLPADRHGPPGKKAEAQQEGADHKAEPEAGQSGEQQVASDTPILGGPQQMGATIQSEADQAIGLNPAHGQDWWKHALESPVETYYMGKHIYNAYYGAFLDPGAIQTSVHDIWHQDNAVGWMLRNAVAHDPGMQTLGHIFGTTPEQTAAGGAGMGLTATADPANLLFAGPGMRGAALVAKFLAPGALGAIFTERHQPSDLAWAVLPALLFGGKLPPSVAAQVEKVAPGALRLFEKMSAAKLAQEEGKTRQQQGQDLVKRILETGAMGPKHEPLALAWEAGMKPLTKEQHYQLASSLMERYGTLDPLKLAPLMVRDGATVQALRNMWTKMARMHYDLPVVAEGEGPMVDPMSHKFMLPVGAQKELEDGYQHTLHMVQQAYLSPLGHDGDPIVSRIRSHLGIGRSSLSTERRWISHLRTIAGKEADNPQEWDLLSRSIEPVGREAEVAYQSLSPEMKVVRDSIRLVAAASGMAGEELDMLQRTHGYLPRVGLVVKDAKTGLLRGHRTRQLFTAEARVHRTLAVRSVDLLTETRLQIEQAYKTTKEANAAVMRQRGYVTQAILNKTPWHEVLQKTGAGVPETDYKEIEAIQAIVDSNPEAAKAQAEEYAKNLLPEFSENPWDALPKFGRQIRAIQSQRAMQDLLNSTHKDGKALAVLTPRNTREVDKLKKDGYASLTLPGFARVMVHHEYADLLEQMAHLHSRKPPGWLAKVLELEGTAVSNIMFAPRIHGVNMAGRLGIAMMRFGPDIREWLHAGMLQKGAGTSLPPMIPGVKGAEDVSAEQYRQIAHDDGVLPPNPGVHGLAGGGMADRFIAKMGEVFGDTDMGRVPLNRDMSETSGAAKASAAARSVLGKTGEMLWGKQGELWQWISDFGVMMYWAELAGALRSGRFEDAARKAMEGAGTPYSVAEHRSQTRAMAGSFAATRANSWMGHVTPEDSNPMLQAVLKSAFFAPHYWRTWAEILTGYYHNPGFGWSKDTIKYVVENEIKTAAAAVLVQQLSANALNLFFSGHSIYQNDPGNWGKVEITQPWAIAAYNEYVRLTAPKDKQKDALIDEKTGRDGKGRKLTWENPAGRQMTQTEEGMGLLTSSPSWTPQTFLEGFSAFGAARTSPVASATAALANIDLYRSISSDGFRYIDPNHDTFLGWDQQGPHPGTNLADLITAGGDLTPFSGIGQQVQQQVMQGNVDNVNVFGLPIPKAVLDAFSPGSLGQDAGKAFLAGMTGTNPPHMRSSRTQGVSPTDDQYKAVHEIQTKYDQHMNSLSTASLGGQLAPYQWLATYRQLSAQHAAQMQAIFLHAPEYNNGPLGLTNSYEGLYDQATDKNGVLQPDQLRSLQQQWRTNHSAADYAAVQNELRHNDSKYPMLALYHKTQDAYHNWQADWCTQNGVDLSTLQSDMTGWSAVYNDRAVSRQWLAEHQEIGQFEAAKRAEFESGQSTYGEAGLMYALFFNPTAADRYLTVSGETAQEVEQAVQQEQVAAAP